MTILNNQENTNSQETSRPPLYIRIREYAISSPINKDKFDVKAPSKEFWQSPRLQLFILQIHKVFLTILGTLGVMFFGALMMAILAHEQQADKATIVTHLVLVVSLASLFVVSSLYWLVTFTMQYYRESIGAELMLALANQSHQMFTFLWEKMAAPILLILLATSATGFIDWMQV